MDPRSTPKARPASRSARPLSTLDLGMETSHDDDVGMGSRRGKRTDAIGTLSACIGLGSAVSGTPEAHSLPTNKQAVLLRHPDTPLRTLKKARGVRLCEGNLRLETTAIPAKNRVSPYSRPCAIWRMMSEAAALRCTPWMPDLITLQNRGDIP